QPRVKTIKRIRNRELCTSFLEVANAAKRRDRRIDDAAAADRFHWRKQAKDETLVVIGQDGLRRSQFCENAFTRLDRSSFQYHSNCCFAGSHVKPDELAIFESARVWKRLEFNKESPTGGQI